MLGISKCDAVPQPFRVWEPASADATVRQYILVDYGYELVTSHVGDSLASCPRWLLRFRARLVLVSDNGDQLPQSQLLKNPKC